MKAATTAFAAASIALALVASSAPSAIGAELPTAIEFVTTETTVTYGEPWMLEVRLESRNEWGTLRLGEPDGTVNLFIEGKPGEYITAVPIIAGGAAYFAPPANEAPLAAGVYEATAEFLPAPGSDFEGASTEAPAMITVTPLEVRANSVVITDPVSVSEPTVRTSIDGEFVAEVGEPPPGEWIVTVSDSTGKVAFTSNVSQPTTAAASSKVEALDIPITAKLRAGERYSVNARFLADKALAPGLAIEQPQIAHFETAPLTFGQAISTPIPFPVWLSVTLASVIFSLAGLLALLLVRNRQSAIDPTSEPDEDGSVGE